MCVFMGAECQYSVGWTLKPKYFATYQSRNQVKFDIDGWILLEFYPWRMFICEHGREKELEEHRNKEKTENKSSCKEGEKKQLKDDGGRQEKKKKMVK